MVVIMPVAADLDWEDRRLKSRVILGRETKIACDKALEISRLDGVAGKCEIFVGAGLAPNYNHVWMAHLMAVYMENSSMIPGGKTPDCKVITRSASEFTTWGEMDELTDHLGFIIQTGEVRISQVALAVKWWHAPRAKYLCEYWIRKRGLGDIPVTVTECPTFARCPTILKEFLGAWPKNLVRTAINR